MKVALVFNTMRPDTTGGHFARACQALGVSYDHWQLGDLERIPADYAFYLRIDHGDDYLVTWPDRLRPAAFYATDTHLPHSWRKIRRMARQYDAIFCCHRDATLKLPGSEWLPVACDPVLHGPVVGSRRWDLAFVGYDGGTPRKFYLQALRERYPKSFIGQADYTQLGMIYSQAAIGFNYSIGNDINMRMFEVMAADTLLVTNALEGGDLAALGLEDRRHLVLYRSPGELLETIDHYLAHPVEREQIARAGGVQTRGGHTYRDRMERLLASVTRELGVPSLMAGGEAVSCVSS